MTGAATIGQDRRRQHCQALPPVFASAEGAARRREATSKSRPALISTRVSLSRSLLIRATFTCAQLAAHSADTPKKQEAVCRANATALPTISGLNSGRRPRLSPSVWSLLQLTGPQDRRSRLPPYQYEPILRFCLEAHQRAKLPSVALEREP